MNNEYEMTATVYPDGWNWHTVIKFASKSPVHMEARLLPTCGPWAKQRAIRKAKRYMARECRRRAKRQGETVQITTCCDDSGSP